jgi:hypothetical protein
MALAGWSCRVEAERDEHHIRGNHTGDIKVNPELESNPFTLPEENRESKPSLQI